MAIATVTRTGGSHGTVSVNYATEDGSAIAGRDYSATTGTLTWSDRDTLPKSFAIPLGASAAAANPRSFNVVLSSASSGATLGATRQSIDLVTGWQAPALAVPTPFNLSAWRLNLPVDQFGGTGGAGGTQYGAATISPANLTAGFVDAYFYVDAAGWLVFTAPANGAATSPGSATDHTRSELREVYTGAGADANNDWTSSTGGTLTGTCVVRAVATKSDVATIAQIHGQDNVFVLLLYRPSTHDVAVDVYARNATGSTHKRTPVVTGIGLGDLINYSLTFRDGLVTATVNGVPVSSTVDSSWLNVPVYFKLGAYHAVSNVGNAQADATMVAYSAFSVSH